MQKDKQYKILILFLTLNFNKYNNKVKIKELMHKII